MMMMETKRDCPNRAVPFFVLCGGAWSDPYPWQEVRIFERGGNWTCPLCHCEERSDVAIRIPPIPTFPFTETRVCLRRPHFCAARNGGKSGLRGVPLRNPPTLQDALAGIVSPVGQRPGGLGPTGSALAANTWPLARPVHRNGAQMARRERFPFESGRAIWVSRAWGVRIATPVCALARNDIGGQVFPLIRQGSWGRMCKGRTDCHTSDLCHWFAMT